MVDARSHTHTRTDRNLWTAPPCSSTVQKRRSFLSKSLLWKNGRAGKTRSQSLPDSPPRSNSRNYRHSVHTISLLLYRVFVRIALARHFGASLTKLFSELRRVALPFCFSALSIVSAVLFFTARKLDSTDKKQTNKTLGARNQLRDEVRAFLYFSFVFSLNAFVCSDPVSTKLTSRIVTWRMCHVTRCASLPASVVLIESTGFYKTRATLSTQLFFPSSSMVFARWARIKGFVGARMWRHLMRRRSYICQPPLFLSIKDWNLFIFL